MKFWANDRSDDDELDTPDEQVVEHFTFEFNIVAWFLGLFVVALAFAMFLFPKIIGKRGEYNLFLTVVWVIVFYIFCIRQLKGKGPADKEVIFLPEIFFFAAASLFFIAVLQYVHWYFTFDSDLYLVPPNTTYRSPKIGDTKVWNSQREEMLRSALGGRSEFAGVDRGFERFIGDTITGYLDDRQVFPPERDYFVPQYGIRLRPGKRNAQGLTMEEQRHQRIAENHRHEDRIRAQERAAWNRRIAATNNDLEAAD